MMLSIQVQTRFKRWRNTKGTILFYSSGGFISEAINGTNGSTAAVISTLKGLFRVHKDVFEFELKGGLLLH